MVHYVSMSMLKKYLAKYEKMTTKHCSVRLEAVLTKM